GLLPKTLLNTRNGKFRIFDDVVKKRRCQRCGVHPYIGQDVRNFKQMGEIRLAGAAKLVAVAFGGDVVGAAHQPWIVCGTVFFQLVEQFAETSIQLALSAVAVELQRQIGRPGHNPDSLLLTARKGEPRLRKGAKGKRGTMRRPARKSR